MDADPYARNAIANCLKRTRPQHVEAIGRFFEKKRNGGLKDPSIKSYAVWLSRFSRAHDKPWDAITEAEIQAWLAGLPEQGLAFLNRRARRTRC